MMGWQLDWRHVGGSVQAARRTNHHLPEGHIQTTVSRLSDGPDTLCVGWVAVGVVRADKRSILCSEIPTATCLGDANSILYMKLS